MKLTIVYDNEVLGEGLKSGWGFSAFIEAGDRNILFDAGWNGDDLLHNLGKLGINPGEIDVIVLSHQHWDHIGGLNHVLDEAGNVEVYVPASFSTNLKNEIKSRASLKEVSAGHEITASIYTTGELTGRFNGMELAEQSLAIETSKGILVVTGCSHPGVDKILEAASEFGKLYGIVGGFHGFDKYDALADLKTIAPCHCTEHKKEIKEKYPEKVEEAGAGWIMQVV